MFSFNKCLHLFIIDDYGRKVQFFPLKNSFIGDEQIIYEKVSHIPEKVYGKYSCGAVGYRIAWCYSTIDKKQLIIEK